jgi:hypothetical protein
MNFGKKNTNMIIDNYTPSPWRVFKHPSLLFNSFYWWDLKYQIEAWFKPRQKWLTKTIPNTWCDKVTLIPHLLFSCLTHYVEDEKGLQDHIDWTEDLEKGYISQEYVDSVKNTDKELREVYNYIKTERPELEKQHENSYPTPSSKAINDIFIKEEDSNYTMRSCEDLYGMPYKEAYAETYRLEALIEEKDMWAMQTIIKHYQKLWT